MTEDPKDDRWGIEPARPDAPAAEIDRWERLRGRLIETARRCGWTKTEVSKRSGIPPGSLWQWFDGSYAGVLANQSDKIERWLASIDELSTAAARVPVAPGYIATRCSAELVDALIYAQTMPKMVVVTYGTGMGKTTTARSYTETRAHAHLVTMRPTTASVHGMLQELALALEVHERNPARLDRAIGETLRRNGRNTLLIVDEAQHLSHNAVNQLRFFLDEYGCGIALLGNTELFGRYGKTDANSRAEHGQLRRRIGLRIQRLTPYREDIDAVIAAWGVLDGAIKRLLRAVGEKEGALGTITETLQLAGMYAAGDSRPMTIDDVLRALRNRGLGGVA